MCEQHWHLPFLFFHFQHHIALYWTTPVAASLSSYLVNLMYMQQANSSCRITLNCVRSCNVLLWDVLKIMNCSWPPPCSDPNVDWRKLKLANVTTGSVEQLKPVYMKSMWAWGCSYTKGTRMYFCGIAHKDVWHSALALCRMCIRASVRDGLFTGHTVWQDLPKHPSLTIEDNAIIRSELNVTHNGT